MGEIINPYAGMAYDNKQMWPYYALAESLDVPVAVHLRGAPRMTAQHCCPEFRLEFGDPLTLGKILASHPELRLHVMHADVTAMPELLLLLRQYSNVYVDLTPYNMVVCQMGLQFVPDPPAALREMRRVLAGGVAQVADERRGALEREVVAK